MQVWEAALWGALGGGFVECFDAYGVMRNLRRWPWEDPTKKRVSPKAARRNMAMWTTATLLRLLAGLGVAAALDAGGQLTGPLAAVGIGVAGPTVLEVLSLGGLRSAPALAVVPSGESRSGRPGESDADVG